MADENENSFANKADNAALSLKQSLSTSLQRQYGPNGPHGRGAELQETKVAAGPDGKPPAAPPPEDSYVAMAQRQVEKDRLAATPPQQQSTEAPQEQAQVQTQPTQEPALEVTENANKRIRGLVNELREKDRALQALQAEHTASASTIEELKRRHEALEGSYRSLIEQNLDALDPETRVAVMQDARMQEAIAASERKILATLGPQLQAIRDRDDQDELSRVASKYPGFDYEIHPVLIEEVRRRNPALSVEMAFKAVADPRDLGVGAQPTVTVPPVVEPGSGSSIPRNVPDRSQQSDPVAEMVEEAARARDLAKSNNPEDYKKALRMFDQNIGRRIFGG